MSRTNWCAHTLHPPKGSLEPGSDLPQPRRFSVLRIPEEPPASAYFPHLQSGPHEHLSPHLQGLHVHPAPLVPAHEHAAPQEHPLALDAQLEGRQREERRTRRAGWVRDGRISIAGSAKTPSINAFPAIPGDNRYPSTAKRPFFIGFLCLQRHLPPVAVSKNVRR